MAQLYLGKIPIVKRSLDEAFLGNPEPVRGGAIERDYDIDPPEMGDSPDGIQVLSDADAIAAQQEQEKNESSLFHMYMRQEPAHQWTLDQNGDGYCHTADTEVLTDRGFVAWPDYNWKDLLATVNPQNHAMEFQAPFEKHVYDYDGPMVYSTNRRVNFAVTPDHQMYVRKWDERKRTLSDQYSFARAADIGWYAGLLHAPSEWAGTELVEVEVPGDRRYDGDDFIAMLGLIVSDGFAGGVEKTNNLVSFCSFRDEVRANIAALAYRLGFKEQPSRPGVFNRWGAGELANWVRANCYVGGALKSQNKRIPDIVKVASPRQIKLFLHYFNDRTRSGNVFYSSSKRLIDDLQELHLRIGKRSTIGIRPADEPHEYAGKMIRTKGSFDLCVSETDRLCIDRKKHIEEERYKGPVFCAAVPNHTLITRRGGTTLISSNCWAYSTGDAVMFDRLKQNLPYIKINPHATAAIIKRGRDEGGWCGLSMKWARENGYAVEGAGPGEWPLHSRNLKYDTPELRQAMQLHKAEESWYDLGRREYDQVLAKRQLATLTAQNNPCPADWNKFSHSMDIVWMAYIDGRLHPIIHGSWKNWGFHNFVVLYDLWPNNGVSLRASTASGR